MTEKEKELLKSGVFSNMTLWDIFQAGKSVYNDLAGEETTIAYFGNKMLEKLLQKK